MVSGQCFVTPENMLAPQVRVHTALMHRCVGLESVFDVQLVLLDSHFNVLGVGISSQDSIEVTSHAILLIVEAVVVSATDREDVLGHQLAQHTPTVGKVIVNTLRTDRANQGLLTCRGVRFFGFG